jgi:uncharacterized repeat protein (TIGR01451 family)
MKKIFTLCLAIISYFGFGQNLQWFGPNYGGLLYPNSNPIHVFEGYFTYDAENYYLYNSNSSGTLYLEVGNLNEEIGQGGIFTDLGGFGINQSPFSIGLSGVIELCFRHKITEVEVCVNIPNTFEIAVITPNISTLNKTIQYNKILPNSNQLLPLNEVDYFSNTFTYNYFEETRYSYKRVKSVKSTPSIFSYSIIDKTNKDTATNQIRMTNTTSDTVKYYNDTLLYVVCPCTYAGGGNPEILCFDEEDLYEPNNGTTLCDSAYIYINIFLDTIPKSIFAGNDTTVCQNKHVILTATGASNYTWSNGQSGASITVSPSVTTTYIVTGTVLGSTQRDTVVVFVKNRTVFNNNQSICAGQSYTINGKTYSIAGTYRDTLFNANSQGCDSIIVTILEITTPTFNNYQEICFGSSYTVNGNTYNLAGTYYDTLFNATNEGCDSIVITYLSLITNNVLYDTVLICEGNSYFNGYIEKIYNESGDYTDTIDIQNDCVVIIYTHVTVKPLPNISLTYNFISDFEVQFLAPNGNDINNWEIFDGTSWTNTTETNPTILYSSVGTFAYNFSAILNGCSKDTAGAIDIVQGFNFIFEGDDTIIIFPDPTSPDNTYPFGSVNWNTVDYELINHETTGQLTFEYISIIGSYVPFMHYSNVLPRDTFSGSVNILFRNIHSNDTIRRTLFLTLITHTPKVETMPLTLHFDRLNSSAFSPSFEILSPNISIEEIILPVENYNPTYQFTRIYSMNGKDSSNVYYIEESIPGNTESRNFLVFKKEAFGTTQYNFKDTLIYVACPCSEFYGNISCYEEEVLMSNNFNLCDSNYIYLSIDTLFVLPELREDYIERFSYIKTYDSLPVLLYTGVYIHSYDKSTTEFSQFPLNNDMYEYLIDSSTGKIYLKFKEVDVELRNRVLELDIFESFCLKESNCYDSYNSLIFISPDIVAFDDTININSAFGGQKLLLNVHENDKFFSRTPENDFIDVPILESGDWAVKPFYSLRMGSERQPYPMYYEPQNEIIETEKGIFYTTPSDELKKRTLVSVNYEPKSPLLTTYNFVDTITYYVCPCSYFYNDTSCICSEQLGTYYNYYSIDSLCSSAKIIIKIDTLYGVDISTNNGIIGRIYQDINNNNQPDAGDVFSDNIKVSHTSINKYTVHTTADTGKYSFITDTGTYVIKPFSNFSNFKTIPDSAIISHHNYGNIDTVNFKLGTSALVNDASIIITNNFITRPARQNSYTITYTNESGQTYNGTIKLKLDNRLNFQNTTPSPTSIVGDTIIWNISNLPLFSSKNIVVNFLADTLSNNDSLYSFVKIYNTQTDITPENNEYSLLDVVRAAYDPNDKISDKSIITPQQIIDNNQYITYTIRFQNVGNDTAFNIYINDTLDNNLDWNTIQPISSSHDYNFEQINGKYLTFNFLNIQLPDSNTNQTLSHGYISFKIKPKNNLLLDDIISNKASIVFDVNVPIVTNDVQTNIAELRSSSVVINCSENSSSDQPFIIQRKPYDALPQSYWTGATVDGFVQGVSQINFTFNNVPSGMNVTAAVNSGGQVVILVNSIIQSNLVEFELEICDATTNACCTQHIHFYSIPPKVVAKNDTIHFSSLQAGQDYFINVFNNDRYFSEYPENNYVTIPILSNGNWAVKANYQLSLDENTNEMGSSSTTSIANITTNNNSNFPDRLQNNIFYQPKNNLTTQYNVKDSFVYYVCPCSYYTNYNTIDCGFSEYFNLHCSEAKVYINIDTIRSILVQRDTIVDTLDVCAGESVTIRPYLPGITIIITSWSNGHVGDSLVVSPNTTSNYFVEGFYENNNETIYFRWYTNVIVKPRTTFNNSQSICQGQTYTINGKTYSTAGTYRDTLRNANSQGCDSIIVTNLTIKNLPDVNFTKSINNNTVVFTAPNGNDSYTWTFGDGNSSSIQNPTHTYQSIGNYNITLQSTLNSCSNSKSDSVSIISTAIKNNISFVDKIEVYPNPTDRFLTIYIKSNKTADFSLILTSLDGKIIYEKFTENTIHVNEKIDMSQVATGMYFLKVISKGEQAIIKILKK